MFKILAVTILFAGATLGRTVGGLPEFTTGRVLTQSKLTFGIVPVLASGDWIIPSAADEYELVPVTRDKRLVNGTPATIEEFPYQVLLFKHRRNNLWYPICGGAIISSYWVVTAAHCVDDGRGEYSARAGSAQRLTGGTDHKADMVLLHPDYLKNVNTKIGDDIALLRVESPFEFDTTRQPVSLYNIDEETKLGTNVVITGWGNINDSDSPKAQVLQRITLSVTAKDKCKGRFQNSRGLIVNLDNVICAGSEYADHATCSGDSGSPVTVDARLVGLVSLGQATCTGSTTPVIATEVAKYRQWIRDVSGI